MKLEKFIFIGKDGSLGFRHGQAYWIEVNSFVRIHITYKTKQGEIDCPYESWRAFFKNWKFAE